MEEAVLVPDAEEVASSNWRGFAFLEFAVVVAYAAIVSLQALIVLMLLTVDRSGAALALLLTWRTLTQGTLPLVGGFIADRYPRVRMLKVIYTAGAVGSLVGAGASLGGPVMAVLVLAIPWSIVLGITPPFPSVIRADLLRTLDYERGAAIHGVLIGITGIVAQAGILASGQMIGITASLALVGCCFAIATVSLVAVPSAGPRKDEQPARYSLGVVAALVGLAAFLALLPARTPGSATPPAGLLSASSISWTIALTCAGAFVWILGPRLRSKWILPSVAVLVAASAVIPWLFPVVGLAWLVAPFAFSQPLFTALLVSRLLITVPVGQRGRAMGSYSAALNWAINLGRLLRP